MRRAVVGLELDERAPDERHFLPHVVTGEDVALAVDAVDVTEVLILVEVKHCAAHCLASVFRRVTKYYSKVADARKLRVEARP